MKLYDELINAINATISVSVESDDFKIRFSKLIENYFENSYTESDINEVIRVISFTEVRDNGN